MNKELTTQKSNLERKIDSNELLATITRSNPDLYRLACNQDDDSARDRLLSELQRRELLPKEYKGMMENGIIIRSLKKEDEGRLQILEVSNEEIIWALSKGLSHLKNTANRKIKIKDFWEERTTLIAVLNQSELNGNKVFELRLSTTPLLDPGFELEIAKSENFIFYQQPAIDAVNGIDIEKIREIITNQVHNSTYLEVGLDSKNNISVKAKLSLGTNIDGVIAKIRAELSCYPLKGMVVIDHYLQACAACHGEGCTACAFTTGLI